MSLEYMCIWKDTDKTKNCKEHCCGITNICGLYENKLGVDPFKNKCRKKNWKQRNHGRGTYEDEELGIYY